MSEPKIFIQSSRNIEGVAWGHVASPRSRFWGSRITRLVPPLVSYAAVFIGFTQHSHKKPLKTAA